MIIKTESVPANNSTWQIEIPKSLVDDIFRYLNPIFLPVKK